MRQIVEVSLDGELRYWAGLQWFFRERGGPFRRPGHFEATAAAAGLPRASLVSVTPWRTALEQVRAVLNALSSDEKVNVISAPSVMVLDNQSATIKVGDQVPVRVSETTNLDSACSPSPTSQIQFRDTGVTLEVRPRVQPLRWHGHHGDPPGGQRRSHSSHHFRRSTPHHPAADGGERRVVRSGRTIVLGGLIRENRSRNQSGLPGLRKLPVVGPLFGTTTRSNRRTELLVMLTPRVAENEADAAAITREFRERLQGLSRSGDTVFTEPTGDEGKTGGASGNDAE
ncbi:MAG: hypothetical protein U5L11_00390 [Arhodomonas sp.]|nr:hypothetical protein [Arhodomonas sp.]